MTRTEVRVVAVIITFLVAVGAMPTFQSHLHLWCLLAIGVAFLATANSCPGAIACLGFCGLVAVLLLKKLPEADVLRTPVAGKAFVNAPFVDVLDYLALQKKGSPSLRFYVWDDALAHSKLSVNFRKGDTLKDAMAEINRVQKTEFDWHWHKFCGNEPTSLCAEIRISPSGLRPALDDSNYKLLLDHGEAYWTKEDESTRVGNF